MSWVLDKGGSGITIATDEVGSLTSSFENFIRSAPMIRKFSDSTGGGIIAGDLDTGGDKIADGEGDNRARCIGAFTVISTTFFSEKAEYSFSELGGRRRETKEGMGVGSLVRGLGRGRAQAKVEREAERLSNSRNTANNISTVNGAAVPSVISSFNKNRISATIIGGNSNSFIEESVEVFNSDSFVIAVSSDVEVNGKNSTNNLEESFKSAAVVDDN